MVPELQNLIFRSFLRLLLFFILFIGMSGVFAQERISGQKQVVAGAQYKRSSFHQWLWGKHYRKDWATPVMVPTLDLSTVNGGLVAYEKGGGRQSKSLRLRNPQGKEYVLRSIDKSFGKALPDIVRGTFIEKIVDDQVSIAQPYSAVTIPQMSTAAGIYHTNPQIVFIPSQKALGEFDKDYGNELYMLEERPDENWEEAPFFGNSKNIVGTDKMLKKILEENDRQVDQEMYVRARLFDMFIGDWGRHEDQWRWATTDEGDNTIYRPIPRDRDQAYTKFDGALLHTALSAVANKIETFSDDIGDVTTYNYTARNLDRKLTNEVTKEQWIRIAEELRSSLPDNIITTSINKLPPEIAALSAEEIIRKLKSRRDHLVEYATGYYNFLAKEVEVTGTGDAELFRIKSDGPNTTVEIFDLNKEGQPKKKPFYARTFHGNETKEVRVYGIGGNDKYEFEGHSDIKLRVIGGPAKDLYKGGGNNNLLVYDNPDNDFSQLSAVKKKLSENPYINLYNYEGFEYDKKGIGPILSYSSEDHIHVGLKYELEKQQWRKHPFGYRHEIAARYSISESAPSIGYTGVYTKFVGNWNLHIDAGYDWIRWNNFYGVGNETVMLSNNRDYHRVRNRQLDLSLGLQRQFANFHSVSVSGFYQTIKVLNDPGRYLTTKFPSFKGFETKSYAGANLDYVYQRLNNTFLPSKGIRIGTNIRFTQNSREFDSSVLNLSSVINIYIPITKALVFALKTGGATLTGDPEFFQLSKLGGSKTLRGFRKYRFYGESMFYNQAELQFIPDVKTYLFSGKAGLIVFYDIGRVWQPGENSSTWHAGYGGGIVLAPFNKFSVAILQGWSKNEKAIAIRFSGSF